VWVCGKDGQWDKCVGVPSGYLEPSPVKTVQGCDCLLPFEYEPKVLASQDGPKRFVYTAATDIANAHGGAWCATVGQCGHTSNDAKAHYGPGGFGWTNWDVVVEQPPARPLLTGDDAGKDQHVLPAEVPDVRTQHGCTCQLPWKYAPAYTCAVSEDDEGACLGMGGYMMSGWCVLCKDLTYTGCSRADQDASWCAVEGDCGVASTDKKAMKTEAEGGYSWSHWDNCIGSPAGFIPPPEETELKTEGAKLVQKHGVSVESVVMKHDHKVVVGPPKADLTATEIKELALKKAIAQAVHQKGAAAAAGKGDGSKSGARGRGQRKSDKTDKKTDKEIKALAKQMRQSIKSLDSKIQKLDESRASSLRSTGLVTAILAGIVALVGARVV